MDAQVVTCPDCGHEVSVKTNGKLRAHANGPKGERRGCEGANLSLETVKWIESERARKAKAT